MDVIIIGAGSAGARHIFNTVLLGHEPVAVADPFMAEELQVSGPTTYYRDPERCLRERAEGSIVIIASPTMYHCEQTLLAIDCGCYALLVEKPMALNARQAADMRDAAEAMGVLAAVGHNFRFHPIMEHYRMLIDKFPSPRVFTTIAVDDIMKWPTVVAHGKSSYVFDKDQGGIVLTSSSHGVDLALFLNGAANYVTVTTEYTDAGLDKMVLVRLNHESGSVSIISNSWENREYSVMTLMSPFYMTVIDLCRVSLKPDLIKMHERMMLAFLQYAGSGEAGDLCTFAGGHRVMEIIDAVRSNKEVSGGVVL